MPKDYSEDNCVVKCSADLNVDLGAKPEATCEEVGHRGTSFDIAVKTRVNPKCQLTYRGSKQSACDPCETVSYLRVNLDTDCDVEIVKTPCGRPSTDYKIKVNVPVSPKVQVRNICKDKTEPAKPHHKPKSEPKKPKDHGMAVPRGGSNAGLIASKTPNYVQQLSREANSKSQNTIRA